jgi:hypothetical protein
MGMLPGQRGVMENSLCSLLAREETSATCLLLSMSNTRKYEALPRQSLKQLSFKVLSSEQVEVDVRLLIVPVWRGQIEEVRTY